MLGAGIDGDPLVVDRATEPCAGGHGGYGGELTVVGARAAPVPCARQLPDYPSFDVTAREDFESGRVAYGIHWSSRAAVRWWTAQFLRLRAAVRPELGASPLWCCRTTMACHQRSAEAKCSASPWPRQPFSGACSQAGRGCLSTMPLVTFGIRQRRAGGPDPRWSVLHRRGLSRPHRPGRAEAFCRSAPRCSATPASWCPSAGAHQAPLLANRRAKRTRPFAAC
jgi:hypothetical protein